MRKLLVLAVGAIAGTLMLASAPANAMTLPAPAGLAAAGEAANPVEQVRTVCRRYWNGYRWRQRCFQTAPRFYGGYGYRPYRHSYRPVYRHRPYRGGYRSYGYRRW